MTTTKAIAWIRNPGFKDFHPEVRLRIGSLSGLWEGVIVDLNPLCMFCHQLHTRSRALRTRNPETQQHKGILD